MRNYDSRVAGIFPACPAWERGCFFFIGAASRVILTGKTTNIYHTPIIMSSIIWPIFMAALNPSSTKSRIQLEHRPRASGSYSYL